MFRRSIQIVLVLAACASFVSFAAAQNYDLSWYTIDGGGGTSTGGAFQLGGTMGQPDAQAPPVMSGGPFQLTGGFWPAADGCALPGDMNLDGHIDGPDVQHFVNCLIGSGGTNCICADLDAGGIGPSDVPAFVAALLG